MVEGPFKLFWLSRIAKEGEFCPFLEALCLIETFDLEGEELNTDEFKFSFLLRPRGGCFQFCGAFSGGMSGTKRLILCSLFIEFSIILDLLKPAGDTIP